MSPRGTSRERWTAGSVPLSWSQAQPGQNPAALVQRSSAENRRGAGGDSDHRPLLSRGPLPHPGGASARRRFLDGAICQLRPRYAQALAEYNRLYEHKTRILRDWQENPSLLDTLDDFNLRMAQFGARIIHYRAHFVRRLGEQPPHPRRFFRWTGAAGPAV